MKTRYLILLSIAAGLIAVSMDAFPMWWGVLFSPITEQLSCEPVNEELTKGFCWQVDDFVFRLKGLDLLHNFFAMLQK